MKTLNLAARIEQHGTPCAQQAADELRRLHHEVVSLREALSEAESALDRHAANSQEAAR